MHVQATTFAVTCGHIWEDSNDATNDKGMMNPERVAGKVKAYVENIILHFFKSKPANRRDPNLVQRWSPPPLGKVCVNVDAALFPGESRSVGVQRSETLQVFSY
jgi:hypothetical protein